MIASIEATSTPIVSLSISWQLSHLYNERNRSRGRALRAKINASLQPQRNRLESCCLGDCGLVLPGFAPFVYM